jgi:hypothetical protein
MKNIILAAALLACCGCAVQKDWVATGGSRSDGVVELSYEYTNFEKPVLDGNQGLGIAKQRCGAWGYSEAEPFGGVKQACQIADGLGGCNRWIVTMDYQCID